MIYSHEIKELRDIVRKKDGEPFWESRLFWRRLSIYITWFCTKISIPAFTIPLIGLIFFITSIVCFFYNSSIVSWIGVLSLCIYRLLDHVDGELDRYEVKVLKKTPTLLRKYLDSMGHKFSPAVFFAIGFAVDKQTGTNIFTLFGFLSGLFISGIPSEQAKLTLTPSIIENPLLVKEKVPQNILKLPGSSHYTKPKLWRYLTIVKEIFFFQGWMTLISIVIVLDPFLSSPVIYGYSIPYRGLFLIFITPLYFIHLVCAITWYSYLMSSIIR